MHVTSMIIVFYIYFGDVGWFMNIETETVVLALF